ncbi:feruloyl-CoA synthase [Caenimonas soli]|uniref:feruloyl-CoA synthase n=1 Tax=Caenimonas soli TaxID=2735555 RepID=UPI0015566933|nr:feruloyl-CoA synthase [Caenimonas soli]NPC57896.1 feruloyl-CoA synthase [Caenimonas soli]
MTSLGVRTRLGADGSQWLQSSQPLGDYPARMSQRLQQWAETAPERVFVAQRDHQGAWRSVTYAQMFERALAVGQALVERGLNAERPVAIMSGNDIEHMTMVLGAMWAGIPSAAVSTSYSLLANDHERLRQILASITPGLLFASGPAYRRALDAVASDGVEVVLAEPKSGDGSTAFATLLATVPGDAVDKAHAATGPDTVVKFLFTSGSTRQPKAVVNTHRMWCSNQQMVRQCLDLGEPPVLVDWLPWSHTFGGNHNVGIALYNGGTLYIDEGSPTVQGMATTLRNLREVAPTHYFNVPKGFEELALALEQDALLGQSLFSRLQRFMYAGAGLSQAVWDKLDAAATRYRGRPVPMLTSLGMTETAPACTFALAQDLKAGHIGLPCPGVDVKLVPAQGKLEIRFRGPNVMPGYWRQPQLTADAFDDEGFLRTGDAVRWVDAAQPLRGLLFDGRIAEDFKLSSGTFVSVGPLRSRVIAAGAPCVQDVAVAGLNRNEVGLLVFPQLQACRQLSNLAPDTPAADVLQHEAVQSFFRALAQRLWDQGGGSAGRVARFMLMLDQPSSATGELTDKGSLNQANVLRNRSAKVDALYSAQEGTDALVIMPVRLRAGNLEAPVVPTAALFPRSLPDASAKRG